MWKRLEMSPVFQNIKILMLYRYGTCSIYKEWRFVCVFLCNRLVDGVE